MLFSLGFVEKILQHKGYQSFLSAFLANHLASTDNLTSNNHRRNMYKHKLMLTQKWP